MSQSHLSSSQTLCTQTCLLGHVSQWRWDWPRKGEMDLHLWQTAPFSSVLGCSKVGRIPKCSPSKTGLQQDTGNGEQEVYPVGNKRSTQQGANGLPKGVLCRQGEQGQKFQQQGRGGVFFLPFQERFQLNQQWDGTHVVIYCKPITSAWFNPLLIL